MQQYTSLLAIDYGTHKTGIAYSVESFAFAYSTIPTRDLLTRLPELIKNKKSQALVIGMPYNIDGTMSKHGRRVAEFAKKLEAHINVPIIFHDERLSTAEARMSFDEDGIEGDIDAEAARLILVGFLEGK